MTKLALNSNNGDNGDNGNEDAPAAVKLETAFSLATGIFTHTFGGGKKRKGGAPAFAQVPVTIQWADLPDSAKERVILYGLKQDIQDTVASVETDGEYKAAIEKRIMQLKSGDLAREKSDRDTSFLTRTIDQRVKYKVTDILKAKMEANGLKIKDIAKTVFDGLVAQTIADDKSPLMIGVLAAAAADFAADQKTLAAITALPESDAETKVDAKTASVADLKALFGL